MTHERFLLFTHTIESFHKTIQRIKNGYASFFSVKSIHLFWLCELLKSPEGLTPSMLAKEVSIDRSLVSREISYLKKCGYVEFEPTLKRNYNTPIKLTEKGRLAAQQINEEALGIQDRADSGISDDELKTFYTVSQKILKNLSNINPSKEKSKGISTFFKRSKEQSK